jgi:cell wall-associated NlpC family hydrolase
LLRFFYSAFLLLKIKGEMQYMFKIKSKILKKLGQANTSLRLFHLRACPKSLPAAKSQLLRKLTTGFMAGLCAFSMLGSSMSGVITANAASTSTENSAFPSADTVIAKAATLLGSPYTFGNKGYWYAYNQGQYTPLSVQTINNLGIDCSGLVYYTLTQLGYSTSGFSWNNPVPVDTAHWLTVSDSCTITYNGVTSKVGVEKANIKTTDRPYWECSDGSTITPGSVVVAENPGGIDHAWIYMGEFDSRSDVVSYLKSIGVSESLITSSTVGDGTGAGGTHWRIESNGSQGVVINNNTDGKTATAMNMYAFRITKPFLSTSTYVTFIPSFSSCLHLFKIA